MSSHDLRLPDTTRLRLEEFQQRVRLVKIAEGGLAGFFGLAISWMAVFVLDRFVDTPAELRTALLLIGSVGLAVFFPLKCHRWVWGTRRMEQVATLLKHKFPALGDQLLGVVELARNPVNQGSSHELAAAAILHVDRLVRDRDFSNAVPKPRHKVWAAAAAIPAALILLALIVVPAAGKNALARWIMPWRHVDRYTFAQIERIPKQINMPKGEQFVLKADLLPETKWSPESGKMIVNHRTVIPAPRQDKSFEFLIPPQTESATIDVRIGDIRDQIQVTTATRPELTSLKATVTLPDYLKYSRTITSDVRGGSISLVRGASAAFEAEISRALREASVQGSPTSVSGNRIVAQPVAVMNSAALELEWQDELGLMPREPFQLKINAVDDEAPAVSCQQQEPQQVVLTTDVITFDVSADDDFGVRRVGLAWTGASDRVRNSSGTGPAFRSGNSEAAPEDVVMSEPDSESSPAEDPAPGAPVVSDSQSVKPLNTSDDVTKSNEPVFAGEKVVVSGEPEGTQIKAVATFCAETDGVRPQKLELRAWAEDYNPDRGRVYSPVYVLHVMTPEEHAVWIADQLRRWASRADDVYEEEMRLHETNRELRQLNAEALAQPENQRTIEQQAAAEQANAARLGTVTSQGKQLIQQAMRNPDMLVGHLETWASVLQRLDQMASRRMPSIASLLTSAAATPGQQSSQTSGEPAEDQKPTEMAGNLRNDSAGKSSAKAPKPPSKAVPQLVDVESGFNKPQDDEPEDSEKKSDDPDQKPKNGKFSIPGTVLNGGPPQKKKEKQDGETQKKPSDLDEAVDEQADLLLEFEKVRDELQRIMDDLENSTFVKRFKAASRKQMEVAADLNRTLTGGFGLDRGSLKERQSTQTETIATREDEQSRFVSMIQSDLEAYLGRKKEEKFVRILEEMKQTAVVMKLADVGVRVRSNLSGDSISRAEFWADTLDRWGEELVSASQCGQCKGGNSASLPPAIVLEIMRILEGEIDLRDATRSLGQARPAMPPAQYSDSVQQQAVVQADLHERTLQVSTDIRGLPEGDAKFAQELQILDAAGDAMADAMALLRLSQTGPEVIAAETEAIELLLQAKRANPKSGGGGSGSTPGMGGDGTTDQAALALLGSGSDASAVIQERGVQQSTGKTAGQLPEEFRDGLDAFFNAIETGK